MKSPVVIVFNFVGLQSFVSAETLQCSFFHGERGMSWLRTRLRGRRPFYKNLHGSRGFSGSVHQTMTKILRPKIPRPEALLLYWTYPLLKKICDVPLILSHSITYPSSRRETRTFFRLLSVVQITVHSGELSLTISGDVSRKRERPRVTDITRSC